MTYEDIKDFAQRCEEHPAHQKGMVSYQMIQSRLEEEIDELREYIEALAQPAVAEQHEQEPDRFCDANCTWSDHHPDCKYGTQEPACSGCGKTNTLDSQWACYCVDCWTNAQPAVAEQHEQEPDRFCDANCTWSDHHPDCKYGTQNSDELTVAYMSGLYDGKNQAKPQQEQPNIKSYPGKDNSQPMKLSDYEPDGVHHNKPIRSTHDPAV